jgi:hypothetical protein
VFLDRQRKKVNQNPMLRVVVPSKPVTQKTSAREKCRLRTGLTALNGSIIFNKKQGEIIMKYAMKKEKKMKPAKKVGGKKKMPSKKKMGY